nr:MAG TPA: Protein of unknown function (DUF1043) [Caudoviricetes sp.]
MSFIVAFLIGFGFGAVIITAAKCKQILKEKQ